jgi:transposase
MEKVSIIGVGLAKHVFQMHGTGANGSVVFRKKISQAKFLPLLSSQLRCVVAMEAYAGAHGWARGIQAWVQEA